MNVKIVKLNFRVFGKPSELTKISSRENIDLYSSIFFSNGSAQYESLIHYVPAVLVQGSDLPVKINDNWGPTKIVSPSPACTSLMVCFDSIYYTRCMLRLLHEHKIYSQQKFLVFNLS